MVRTNLRLYCGTPGTGSTADPDSQGHPRKVVVVALYILRLGVVLDFVVVRDLGVVLDFVVVRDARTLVSDRDLYAARNILPRFLDSRLSTFPVSSSRTA